MGQFGNMRMGHTISEQHKEKIHVTYDKTTNESFEVHNRDATKCLFISSKKGLFHLYVKSNAVLVTKVEDEIN